MSTEEEVFGLFLNFFISAIKKMGFAPSLLIGGRIFEVRAGI
jgi:hypothetical protein